MITSLSAAISGLKAASKRTHNAGNNIANLNSRDYKRGVPVQSDTTSGAVKVAIKRDNSPGFPIPAEPEANLPAAEESNVDLPTEMVELIKARRSLQANVKTIQAANENLGSILDIKS